MARIEDYIREMQNSRTKDDVMYWYEMSNSDPELSGADHQEANSIASAAIKRILERKELNESTGGGSAPVKVERDENGATVGDPIIQEKEPQPRVESSEFSGFRQAFREATSMDEVKEITSNYIVARDEDKLNAVDCAWLRYYRAKAEERVTDKITPVPMFVRAGLDLMSVSDRTDLVETVEKVIANNHYALSSTMLKTLTNLVEEVKVINGWD